MLRVPLVQQYSSSSIRVLLPVCLPMLLPTGAAACETFYHTLFHLEKVERAWYRTYIPLPTPRTFLFCLTSLHLISAAAKNASGEPRRNPNLAGRWFQAFLLTTAAFAAATATATATAADTSSAASKQCI